MRCPSKFTRFTLPGTTSDEVSRMRKFLLTWFVLLQLPLRHQGGRAGGEEELGARSDTIEMSSLSSDVESGTVTAFTVLVALINHLETLPAWVDQHARRGGRPPSISSYIFHEAIAFGKLDEGPRDAREASGHD